MTRAPLARIRSRCLARLGADLCTTVVGLLAWGFVPTTTAQDTGAQAPPALTAPPPARIGQLFYTSGNARMRMDRVSSWEPAVLNTPLTVGTGLATQGGGAEVRVGSAALHLAPDAQVIWHELDDTSLHVEVVSGMVGLRVRAIAAGERVLISAGGVKVHVRKPGYYRIRQVPPGTRLAVWVLEGQARVAANPQEAVLGPNQHVVVDRKSAGVLFSGANDEARPFDGIVEMRNRRSEASFSLLNVSAEMTGVEALDGHGKWRTEAGHGAVWFPDKLPQDWAPYRFGHWRWQAPWGWTWMDDAAWGFAPFHYGRWLFLAGRWGWVSGQTATGPAARAASRPVYAPALVGFYGTPDSETWTPGLHHTTELRAGAERGQRLRCGSDSGPACSQQRRAIAPFCAHGICRFRHVLRGLQRPTRCRQSPSCSAPRQRWLRRRCQGGAGHHRGLRNERG